MPSRSMTRAMSLAAAINSAADLACRSPSDCSGARNCLMPGVGAPLRGIVVNLDTFDTDPACRRSMVYRLDGYGQVLSRFLYVSES